MFFWIELSKTIDAEALLPIAEARGVAFVPGRPFFAGAPRVDTLRLSFVTVGVDAIERGVMALAEALDGSYREEPGMPRSGTFQEMSFFA